MELVFLGTGAAEGVPSYYCRCAYCMRVRQEGGKNIRSRSSFRIDAKHQIDFGPDIFHQLTRLGLDVYDLEHLLITHTHEDHFDLAELLTKQCTIEHNEKLMHIYLSEPAAEWTLKQIASYSSDPEKAKERFSRQFVLHPLKYFETYRIGDLEAATVPGSHRAHGVNELAINYLLKLPDGTTLHYALDTGWYAEESWEFLKGRRTDILIMESTFGNRAGYPVRAPGHLDLPNFLLMLDRMREIGFIDDRTRIFASHINSAHSLLHDEMQAEFDRSAHKVTVAYDGMVIGSIEKN